MTDTFTVSADGAIDTPIDEFADPVPLLPSSAPVRVTSIDAVRGLVMFTMIYVNDIAGADEKIVPDWMVHFSDRHKGNVSGMTFVDLVFPAFLFIVGLAIPIAMTSRLAKGDSVWKLLGHVLLRTLALLAIGILMVNGESAGKDMIISANSWWAIMMSGGILAFCSISPGRRASQKTKQIFRYVTLALRLIGYGLMIFTLVIYQSRHGDHKIITLQPFSIRTGWYGILGLIGWAYLVASIVFLVFRTNKLALLMCTCLLMSFYAAERNGTFNWLGRWQIVDVGGTLGSQAAITTAGVLLGAMLLTGDTETHRARIRFTLMFALAAAVAALVLHKPFGISKNAATPAWCCWSIAITALLWLGFYLMADVLKWRWLAWPFAMAGANVLLAYLLREMLDALLNVIDKIPGHAWRAAEWYDNLATPDLAHAMARSAGCAVVLLAVTALLNRVGFRLKL